MVRSGQRCMQLAQKLQDLLCSSLEDFPWEIVVSDWTGNSVGVLAGGIAHDLNNFLMVLLGNISMARSASDPAEKC